MGKYGHLFTNSDEYVVCNNCNWCAKRPSNHSTSLLRYHLKANHRDILAAVDGYSQAYKRRKLEDIKGASLFVPSPPVKIEMTEFEEPKYDQIQSINVHQAIIASSSDGAVTAKAERALMQFICAANLPLSIVESSGLRNFVAVLCPSFEVRSSAEYGERVLNTVYEEYKIKVKYGLNYSPFISFTTDSQLSEDKGRSAISLTAHFIDANMDPQSAIVAVSLVDEGRTADSLKDLLTRALLSFNIHAERVHLIVRAAGTSAIKDGMNMLGVSDAREDSIIARLSTIVRQIKKSRVRRDALPEYRAFYEIPETLFNGAEARWDLTYEMVSRFLENRPTVELFLVNHPRCPSIDHHDWITMKNLAEMLKPIVVATKLVQRGRHTPISVVIPLYKVILRELSAEASLERSARDAVAEGLRRRVEEERYEDREEFVIATMMPRENYSSGYVEHYEQADEENPFLKFSSQISRKPSAQSPEVVNAKVKAFAEMEDYLSRPSSFTVDPFEFWRCEVNSANYPLIKQLSVRYLSAPLTCEESELSNTAVNLIHANDALPPESLEKLLFLQQNVPVLGFQ
ncbi:unnamed protein product [Heligmosomoides polygyrus]|uniref:Dimer_Tnp_hAT domain-containing protein n=1 Tax=Heligmosomoides polygyrus TaxID=6339 RepID=A0A183FR86_HELPZ|nr:unnamed protein product [Heligmosomoides polygyrus]